MTAGQPETSFRPRSAYLGHPTVESGDGAVLIEPEILSELRSAASRPGGHPAGGLLHGDAWHDEEGGYTVVDDFVQTWSGTPPGAAPALGHPGARQVGWWYTARYPGEKDGQVDPGTWPMAGRPDGVGLVVYADGALTKADAAPPGWPATRTQPTRTQPTRTQPLPTPRPAPEPEPELEMTLREQSSRSGVQSPLLVPHRELRSRRRLEPQPGAPVLEVQHYVLAATIILILVVLVTVGVMVSSAFH